MARTDGISSQPLSSNPRYDINSYRPVETDQGPAALAPGQHRAGSFSASDYMRSRAGLDQGQLLRSQLQAQVQGDNTPDQNGGINLDDIQGVRGNPNATPEFKQAVRDMADRLGTRPEYLMAVMSFESGGSFSSSAVNSRSGATGLIQFLPGTAQGLGTTTDALSRMSAVEQLQYVEKYFAPFRGRLTTLEGAYTAVLSGSPRPNPGDILFRSGTNAYTQNRELDFNGDGQITSGEATSPVAARLFGGVTRVQQRLQGLGFDPGAPDGIFGPRTSQALADFQRSRNLPASGLIDETTGRALGLAGPAQSPEQPASTLRRGDSGDAVKRLQDDLVALGYMTPAEQQTGPGQFGPRTEAALKAFQRDHGIEETGVLGP